MTRPREAGEARWAAEIAINAWSGESVRDVTGPDARAWIQAGDSVIEARSLAVEYGVTLELGGSGEAQLAFDALGLGRRASRTVVLRRGAAEARVVIAAYGRALRS